MADECDNSEHALANIELEIRARLAAASRAAQAPPLLRNCINCEEPLPQPGRYCCVECREDHEKRTRPGPTVRQHGEFVSRK